MNDIELRNADHNIYNDFKSSSKQKCADDKSIKLSSKSTKNKLINGSVTMATADEASRHEGGPLEKNHLKEMVQRNALETLVFDKITKHIEIEKRAFTRQNTRDETEMKNLLARLQQQQQTTLLNDDDGTSSESGDEYGGTRSDDAEDIDIPSNPYPVIILPKYGAASQPKPVMKPDTQGQKQDQNDELGSTFRTRDRKKEWLGDPEAIQSIRRPRKSALDRKSLLRSQSEQNVLGDFPLGLSLPSSNTSSQASLLLSPRDRANSFSFNDDGSENLEGALNKRGGSLKERPKKRNEPLSTRLVRSYSMLTKSSELELQNKSNRPKGKEADSAGVQKENFETKWRRTKHLSLKEKRGKSDAVLPLTEISVIRKQPLSRKSSSDGNDEAASKSETTGQQSLSRKNSRESKRKIQTGEKLLRNQPVISVRPPTSLEEQCSRINDPKKKQSFHPNRLTPQGSLNNSPNISPLARDEPVFKY